MPFVRPGEKRPSSTSAQPTETTSSCSTRCSESLSAYRWWGSTYTPPANHLAALPTAVNRLASGQSLNVVIMGDSIAADTYGTAFESLAQTHTGGTFR